MKQPRSERGEKPANILLEKHMQELGLRFEREFKFCPERRWKADYHVMDEGLLIEIHGSVYQSGHHTRGKGFEDDREKMNTAVLHGYAVFEFSTGQVLRGEAKEFLAKWAGTAVRAEK